jgi:hypothetical protein
MQKPAIAGKSAARRINRCHGPFRKGFAELLQFLDQT